MSGISLGRFAICSRCQCVKPLTPRFFHRNHKRGHWKSYCKVCTSLYNKEYRLANRAKIKRERKRYREENRERVLQQKRESYLRNRETILAKQKADNERRRLYRETNRERTNETAAQWRRRNPQKVKEAMRRWRERNPGRYAEDRHKRRARKAAAEHVPYTASDINDMWHEQAGCCYYCGTPVFALYHVDHKQPLSRGGADRLENLCIACPFCNISKKDRTEEEFAHYNERRR